MALQNTAAESAEAEQTLTVGDYTEAAAAAEYFARPLRRCSVQAAFCLTISVISASLVYTAHLTHPRWTWVPVTVAAVFLLLSAYQFFARPALERRRVEKWGASCPLALLPQKLTVYADRAVLETECEKITGYFTDYTICAETDRLIAAAGGRERYLLVVKKEGLPPEQAEAVAALFRHAFDGRWYRMPSGKGVRR